MGLFDLLLGSSNNGFKVGDYVRIRLTGQEGNIISVFNDNTYEVELHENGRIEYCKQSELEKIW